jgi:trigger factor
VQAAKVDIPDALVEARARELWDQMIHSLSHQGISKEAYLQISGRSEDEIVDGGKEDAEQALRREAVLAAVIEAEGIEPTEDEVLQAVAEAAEGGSPQKLVERLRSAGRLEALKEDLAQRKALDLIADSAKPISVEQAQARDKLWTPEKETAGSPSGGQLWTPGN